MSEYKKKGYKNRNCSAKGKRDGLDTPQDTIDKVECGYFWRSGGSCLNAKNTGWGIVVPGSLVKMEDEGGEAWVK